ncbi:hypothetical protein QYF36_011767 [Acer negundo]|nr:hypothetical protein QYF36_011767 [Acer negundo]
MRKFSLHLKLQQILKEYLHCIKVSISSQKLLNGVTYNSLRMRFQNNKEIILLDGSIFLVGGSRFSFHNETLVSINAEVKTIYKQRKNFP